MFELGGDTVPPAMAANLTRLIAEGSGDGDAAADRDMRSDIVASYLDLLSHPKVSDVLFTVHSAPRPSALLPSRLLSAPPLPTHPGARHRTLHSVESIPCRCYQLDR